MSVYAMMVMTGSQLRISRDGMVTKLHSTSVFPAATFGFTEGSVYYGSEYVADQTGSEVNITSVVADGDFSGLKMFKVSGTFKCKVAKSGGAVVNVTEGTFVVRYSED